MDNYINHSGGANGSDIQWDIIGKEYGFKNHIHYYYKNKTPFGNFEISEEDVIEGQVKVTLSARKMGRIAEIHQIRDERLIRNWCQVKYSDAIFAIGTIINTGTIMNYGKIALIPQVKGGTGYAVQMAIDNNKPVYVFDQNKKRWLTFKNNKWVFFNEIPKLTFNYAGIGTREINEYGINAIRNIYESNK